MPKPDPGKLRAKASKYLARSKWDKALEVYEELEKVSPNDLKVTQKIGELHRRMGNMDLAVKKYKESAEKYTERDFLVQAIAVYKVILELQPDNDAIKIELGALAEKRMGSPIRKRESSNPRAASSANLPPLKPRVKPGEELKPSMEQPPEEEDEAIPAEAEDEAIPAEAEDEAIPAEADDDGFEVTVDDDLDDGEGVDAGFEEDLGEELPVGTNLVGDDDAGEGGEYEEDYGMIDGEDLADGDIGEEADLDLGDDDFDDGEEEVPLEKMEVLPVEEEEDLPPAGPERTPLFSDLNPVEFERVFELLESVIVEPGEEIVAKGEKGSDIFIVARGQVRVSAETSSGRVQELAELGPSDFFGEIGYFYGERRATVTAQKKCLLLKITKDNMDRVADEFPRVKEVLVEFYRERVLDNLMALSPLFAHLSPEERRRIGEAFVYRVFGPGEVVVMEGDPGDSMFLIKAGEVVVKTVSPVDKEEVELARLKGGDFFGEVSLVKNKPRTATILTVTDTEVLELSRDDFKDIAKNHPEIGNALEKTIERRVEETIKKMMENVD